MNENEITKQEWPVLIRAILDERGKSQAWLARTLGVSERTVSRWITGKYAPEMWYQEKLWNMLNEKKEAEV